MFKENEVRQLFDKDSILIINRNVIPDYAVKKLLGEDAYEHAVRTLNGKYHNAYGIGDFSLNYLTYEGFQIAATFYNVKNAKLMQEVRKLH